MRESRKTPMWSSRHPFNQAWLYLHAKVDVPATEVPPRLAKDVAFMKVTVT
jgi:hypothetical protein